MVGRAFRRGVQVPNFRSLVAGGFFSDNPSDLSVKRSIRTNNPGALNITSWQRAFPGFAGETQADAEGNVTAIYVTPEHGVGAWYHLLTNRYGYGERGTIMIGALAQKYAGVNSDEAPAAKKYVKGWRRWSGENFEKYSTVNLANNGEVLMLARAVFCHEIGGPSPLRDNQITEAIRLKKDGSLPRN